MAEEYACELLRVCVAQVLHNHGFKQSTNVAMDVYTDVLRRRLTALCQQLHDVTEHAGRTVPVLDDVGVVFERQSIVMRELSDYMQQVQPLPPIHSVPSFPVAFENQKTVKYRRATANELSSRSHIYDAHLPSIWSDSDHEKHAEQLITTDPIAQPINNDVEEAGSSQTANEQTAPDKAAPVSNSARSTNEHLRRPRAAGLCLDDVPDFAEADAFSLGLVKMCEHPPPPPVSSSRVPFGENKLPRLKITRQPTTGLDAAIDNDILTNTVAVEDGELYEEAEVDNPVRVNVHAANITQATTSSVLPSLTQETGAVVVVSSESSQSTVHIDECITSVIDSIVVVPNTVHHMDTPHNSTQQSQSEQVGVSAGPNSPHTKETERPTNGEPSTSASASICTSTTLGQRKKGRPKKTPPGPVSAVSIHSAKAKAQIEKRQLAAASHKKQQKRQWPIAMYKSPLKTNVAGAVPKLLFPKKMVAPLRIVRQVMQPPGETPLAPAITHIQAEQPMPSPISSPEPFPTRPPSRIGTAPSLKLNLNNLLSHKKSDTQTKQTDRKKEKKAKKRRRDSSGSGLQAPAAKRSTTATTTVPDPIQTVPETVAETTSNVTSANIVHAPDTHSAQTTTTPLPLVTDKESVSVKEPHVEQSISSPVAPQIKSEPVVNEPPIERSVTPGPEPTKPTPIKIPRLKIKLGGKRAPAESEETKVESSTPKQTTNVESEQKESSLPPATPVVGPTTPVVGPATPQTVAPIRISMKALLSRARQRTPVAECQGVAAAEPGTSAVLVGSSPPPRTPSPRSVSSMDSPLHVSIDNTQDMVHFNPALGLDIASPGLLSGASPAVSACSDSQRGVSVLQSPIAAAVPPQQAMSIAGHSPASSTTTTTSRRSTTGSTGKRQASSTRKPSTQAAKKTPAAKKATASAAKIKPKPSSKARPTKKEAEQEPEWKCPVCSEPYVEGGDDMIGCDNCDRWFHWVCVGIIEPPPATQTWFCQYCGVPPKSQSTAAARRKSSSSAPKKTAKKK